MSDFIIKILNKKNSWFIMFFVCVLVISIGHSSLNTTLNISGNATARAKTDIRVTNIILKSSSNGGSENYFLPIQKILPLRLFLF